MILILAGLLIGFFGYLVYKNRNEPPIVIEDYFFIFTIVCLGCFIFCMFVPIKSGETTEHKIVNRHQSKNGNMVFFMENNAIERSNAFWSMRFNEVKKLKRTCQKNSFGLDMFVCYSPVLEE